MKLNIYANLTTESSLKNYKNEIKLKKGIYIKVMTLIQKFK